MSKKSANSDRLPRLIKWVGSKWADKLTLPEPDTYTNLVDPFCGSLGFELGNWSALRDKEWHLSDANPDLINALSDLIEQPDVVTEKLASLFDSHSRNQYLETRKLFNEGYRSAASFFYLVQASYRGLPRYNSRGEFNGGCNPDARFRKDDFLQSAIALSDKANSGTLSLVCRRFEDLPSHLFGPDTYLFLDPPYSQEKTEYYSMIPIDTVTKTSQLADTYRTQVTVCYGGQLPLANLSYWAEETYTRSNNLYSQSRLFTQYFYRNF